MCWKCGSLTASNRLQDLRKECPQQPLGANKAKALKRLRDGEAPRCIYTASEQQKRAVSTRAADVKRRRIVRKSTPDEAGGCTVSRHREVARLFNEAERNVTRPVASSAEDAAAAEEAAAFPDWEMSDDWTRGPTLGHGVAKEAALVDDPSGERLLCDCRSVVVSSENASVIVGTESLGIMYCDTCLAEPACDYCSRGLSTLPTTAGQQQQLQQQLPGGATVATNAEQAADVSELWQEYDEHDLLEAFDF